MKNKIIEIFRKIGAISPRGHFVGTSGLHFDTYVNKNALFLHPKITSGICKIIATKYRRRGVEAVVSPALGGIILSQWVAYHLKMMTGREVLAVFSEKDENNNQVLRRGYDRAVKNKKVLIVEDILTTGGSMLRAIKAVQKAGGRVIGVCALINKNPKVVTPESLKIPFETLSEFEVATYEPENCPLCQARIPFNTNLGHGKNSK